jgi:Tol biopolymer transport system component
MRPAALALLLLCACASAAPSPNHQSATSTPPAVERAPLAWSGALTYLALAPGRGQQLFEVSEHFGPIQLTHARGGLQAAGLTWAPDGSRLLFSRGLGTGRGALDVMDADGSHIRRITRDENVVYNEPAWSPRGGLIAFVAGDGTLDVMGSDGTGVRAVFGKPANCGVGDPSWSPTATQLVFSMTCHRSGFDLSSIQAIRVDGTDRRILLGPARGMSFSGPVDPSRLEFSSPSWSPDGADILFVERSDTSKGIRDVVYVLHLDGDRVRRVTDERRDYAQPRWSPDRHFIAAVARRGLYVMRVDGSDPTVVSRARGVVWLAWRPGH